MAPWLREVNFVLILLLCITIPLVEAPGVHNPNLPLVKTESTTGVNTTANSSSYWSTNIGSLDNVNTTQFENNGGFLSIIPSWITSLMGSAYCALTGCTMEGPINMGDEDITNVDAIYATHLNTTTINGTEGHFTKIYASDWTNVLITESQISDLAHTTDTNASNCDDGEYLDGDGSCYDIPSIEATTYNASSIGATDHDGVSGTYADVNTFGGSSYVVQELDGDDFAIFVNYTGVDDFDNLVMRYWYDAQGSVDKKANKLHHIHTCLWDWSGSDWDCEYVEIYYSEHYIVSTSLILDANEHISGGKVLLKLSHDSEDDEGDDDHEFSLDYAVLVDGYVGYHPTDNAPQNIQDVLDYGNSANNTNLILENGDITADSVEALTNLVIGNESASASFRGLGDAYAIGSIKAMEGLYAESKAYGAGLEIMDNAVEVTYHNIMTGDATLTAASKIITDTSANYNDTYIGQFFRVVSSTPSFTGATGEIEDVIDSTHLALSFATSGADTIVDAVDMSYVIYPHPNFFVGDNGVMSMRVGEHPDAKFEIHIPNGTGFYGAYIDDVAGADQHQALTIDVDSQDKDGVVGLNLFMSSSTGADEVSGSAILLEGDASSFSNSHMRFLDINFIGQGTDNEVDIIHIQNLPPTDTHIVHAGEGDTIAKAYYDDADGTTTDVTAAFTSQATDVTIFDEEDSIVYIGSELNFTSISFGLAQTSGYLTIQAEYYYCNSSDVWKELTGVIDTTNGMQQTGTITFANPTDRGTCNDEMDNTNFADATDYAYIAVKRTRSTVWVINVIEDLISISGGGDFLYIDQYGMKPVGSAGEPYPCESSISGMTYYDTVQISQMWCDGSTWQNIQELTYLDEGTVVGQVPYWNGVKYITSSTPKYVGGTFYSNFLQAIGITSTGDIWAFGSANIKSDNDITADDDVIVGDDLQVGGNVISNLNATGYNVTADYVKGDGSLLTGILSGIWSIVSGDAWYDGDANISGAFTADNYMDTSIRSDSSSINISVDGSTTLANVTHFEMEDGYNSLSPNHPMHFRMHGEENANLDGTDGGFEFAVGNGQNARTLTVAPCDGVIYRMSLYCEVSSATTIEVTLTDEQVDTSCTVNAPGTNDGISVSDCDYEFEKNVGLSARTSISGSTANQCIVEAWGRCY